MERTEQGYRLSTGREFYANRWLISIAWNEGHAYGTDEPQWEIGEGYDGGISMTKWDGSDDWTQAERAELADYMIAQWQAFKEGRSGE